jgi:hypothetical protein
MTSWQPRFENQTARVFVQPTPENGLSVESAADILQLRAVATERFIRLLGVIETGALAEITAGVVVAVGYERRSSR